MSATTVQVRTVTPDIATDWLKSNSNNRNIRTAVVEKYRSDMAAGRWTFAGDPIRFDTTGQLIDGQHRLTAISRMPDDFSIDMVIITGLADKAQHVMDQGSKRTGGDQLKIAGVKNSSLVASAVRLVLIHDAGALFKDNSTRIIYASVPAIEEWVFSNLGAVDLIAEVQGNIRVLPAAPSPINAAAVIISRVASTDRVVQFFDIAANGGGPKDSGPNALRSRLMKIDKSGRHLTDRELIANTIRAWNAWVEHKPTTLRDPHHTTAKLTGWNLDNFPTPLSA